MATTQIKVGHPKWSLQTPPLSAVARDGGLNILRAPPVLLTLIVRTTASRAPSMRPAHETLATTSRLYVQSVAPRPTTAPKFDLARRGLQPRLLENVCGWNEENIPRTCGANSYCAFIPDYWGCCGVDSDGVFFTDCIIGTACLDYAAYTASCEPNDCGASVVWCGLSTVPYCEPELLQVQTGGSLTTSTSWRCASIRTSEILQGTSSRTTSSSSTTTTTSSTSTSTPASTSPATTLPITAPATTVIIISVESGSTYSSSVKITSSVAADNPGTAAAGAVGGGTSSASSGGPVPSGQPAGLSASSSTASASASAGKSSNTGPIAGGVVGSVIFIALIAGLVFFLLKKKRSARQPKTVPSDVGSFPKTIPDSPFPATGPKELHSPANYDKSSDGGISELHSSPQYYTQHPALSQSNLVELESSLPGPRTSYYKPGQQTRPQQEMSDVNYPGRTSKHFQIELPG